VSSQKESFFQGDLIMDYDSTKTNPVCFGFAIENPTAGSLAVYTADMHLSMYKYTADMDTFSALGR
jgi:hypothetical protein